MKKVLSIILTMLLMMSIIPTGLLGLFVKAETVTSGTTGDCTWSLDGTVLTISGEGVTGNYYSTWSRAPWGTSITEVIIEDGVKGIGNYAFYECSSLISVAIPDSVTSIGEYVFCYCSSLTSVTIGNGVTIIDRGAFHECSSLTSVAIPNSVTNIDDAVFYRCSSLTSIAVPDSVISIGELAFYRCSSLASVTIGNSVTSIGDDAFRECRSLTSIIIPNSVTSIGDDAFRECRSLTSIIIPNSVTSIGDDAFVECNSLKNVYITDIAAWCNINFESSYSTPLSYADNLYLNDKLITNLVIPEGVTNIGDYAFFGCSSLTSIDIPDSVNSIGGWAFYGCTSLTSISIPFVGAEYNGTSNTHFGYIFGASTYTENKQRIPTSLKTVVINGGNLIDDNAFYECTSLKNIYITGDVRNIGFYAFAWCTNLEKIYIPADVLSIKSYALDKCSIVTVYGLADTEAEEFSYIYSIPFQAVYGFEDGEIIVTPPHTPGDIDGVEGVTDRDAVHLLYYTFLPNLYPVNQDCDFNGDGEVNDKDAIHLLYHTFLPDLYPIK